jgi:hypothetical protein
MALISCELAWEEEGRTTTTGSERIAWYKAFCSSAFDSDKAILTGAHSVNPPAPIVPFDPDPVFGARLCVESFPKRISGSSWFDVQVTYSTDVPFDENPLSTPPEVTIDFQGREIISLFDVNGNPKVNTAGDLLGDPAPTKETYDLIFNVSKNFAIDQYTWLLQYCDSVSGDDVRLKGLTLPAGTLRFAPRGVGKDENVTAFGAGIKNVPFVNVNFALVYRAIGWTNIVPNRGFNQLLPVGKPQPPSLINNNASFATKNLVRSRYKAPKGKFVKMPILIGSPPSPATEPQWLDANGLAIPYPLPGNVILLEWDDYVKLPYNQLPLK